jgi:hypothetical protein
LREANCACTKNECGGRRPSKKGAESAALVHEALLEGVIVARFAAAISCAKARNEIQPAGGMAAETEHANSIEAGLAGQIAALLVTTSIHTP